MKAEEFRSLAQDAGFTVVEPLDPKTLKFLPEVRAMCAADKCRSYNKSWACPPGCGSLEHSAETAALYAEGLLVQTVGDIEDSYDFEGMAEIAKLHEQHCTRLVTALRAAGADFTAMTAGTCTRCEKCTYPDAPCRFPDLLYPSMEACGLVVSDVCRDNGVPYYYGSDKMVYSACILYNGG